MKFAVVIFFGLLAYVSGIPMTLLRKSTPIDRKFNVGDIWSDCCECINRDRLLLVVLCLRLD